MKTIPDLRTVNSNAIDKMQDVVAAIEALMADPGTTLDDESRLIARRSTLHAQINNQSLVQAHLKAARVVVEFDPQQEQDLDALNGQMDQFIVAGLAVNAMLALVPNIIDTAIGIG